MNTTEIVQNIKKGDVLFIYKEKILECCKIIKKIYTEKKFESEERNIFQANILILKKVLKKIEDLKKIETFKKEQLLKDISFLEAYKKRKYLLNLKKFESIIITKNIKNIEDIIINLRLFIDFYDKNYNIAEKLQSLNQKYIQVRNSTPRNRDNSRDHSNINIPLIVKAKTDFPIKPPLASNHVPMPKAKTYSPIHAVKPGSSIKRGQSNPAPAVKRSSVQIFKAQSEPNVQIFKAQSEPNVQIFKAQSKQQNRTI